VDDRCNFKTSAVEPEGVHGAGAREQDGSRRVAKQERPISYFLISIDKMQLITSRLIRPLGEANDRPAAERG